MALLMIWTQTPFQEMLEGSVNLSSSMALSDELIGHLVHMHTMMGPEVGRWRPEGSILIGLGVGGIKMMGVERGKTPHLYAHPLRSSPVSSSLS